ncbi:hypothetical protein VDGL01_02072, partial [Verticillium dahliae]
NCATFPPFFFSPPFFVQAVVLGVVVVVVDIFHSKRLCGSRHHKSLATPVTRHRASDTHRLLHQQRTASSVTHARPPAWCLTSANESVLDPLRPDALTPWQSYQERRRGKKSRLGPALSQPNASSSTSTPESSRCHEPNLTQTPKQHTHDIVSPFPPVVARRLRTCDNKFILFSPSSLQALSHSAAEVVGVLVDPEPRMRPPPYVSVSC